ncbi:MAG: glycosyltransferase family 2 protein [Acutalibacter sp.]
MQKIEYIQGLVSVVIPTYKRFDTLSRAIKSVTFQTYSNIEILVVDDNEPGDNYSCGVRKMVSDLKISNLRLITQERHINGAAARDAGIMEAKGEYIAFLDDDDMWLPNKIEKEIDFIRGLPDQVGAVSNRKVFYKDGRIDHVSEEWKADANQNFKVISKQLNIQTCTLLIKRECLDETGYFDPNLRRHQEVQLMGCFTTKYRVEFLNEILTVIDNSDVMNRPNSEKLMEYKKDYFNSLDSVISTYSKHKQKLIYAHNMTEVAYALYRDGKRTEGIKMLVGCLIYPSVLYTFIVRLLYKRNSRQINKYLSYDEIDTINGYIRECSA